MMADTSDDRGGDRQRVAGSHLRYLTITRAALWLYPLAWRERYAAEVLSVLEQHRVTPWTVFDVLLGAVDAHLRRDLLPGRLSSMAHRIRTSEIAIFVAFVLFCIAWLPLRFVRDPLPDWEDAVRVHPELSAALAALDIAGLVAFLALLAGGLPILASALLGALRARRWSVLLLLAVPVVVFGALVSYGLLAQPYWTQRQSAAVFAPLTPLAVMLQLGLVLLVLAAIVTSTAAISAAIGRSDLSERVLRFALLPAGIAAMAMVAGLLAALALLALIVSVAPQVGTSPPIEVVIALLMLAAALLASVALRRGLAAVRGGTDGA
jgi:hypothetical protein